MIKHGVITPDSFMPPASALQVSVYLKLVKSFASCKIPLRGSF